MTTTGPVEPKAHRGWLRGGINVAAAILIAAGTVLLGISVDQHQQHDHALAVQAARKAEVDRAAVVEAQQFRARLSPDLAESRAHQGRPAGEHAPSAPVEAQKLGTAAFELTAERQAAAAPTRRASPRPRPAAVTDPGAVSQIRGAGATLVIPALSVHAPVVATGAVNGSMTIPADVHIVGWYDGTDNYEGTTYAVHTPWPGQPGVSVLAGHINWVGQGPGALYYIGQLVVGDMVEVIGSNQVATYWRVSQAPITLPKADLPASLFVNTGPPKLALVTCGGPYDPATGHYLDNVIVWATLARG